MKETWSQVEKDYDDDEDYIYGDYDDDNIDGENDDDIDDDDDDDDEEEEEDDGEDVDEYDTLSEGQAAYRVCKKHHNKQPYSVCSGYEHITT
jgi:hypothetical protein